MLRVLRASVVGLVLIGCTSAPHGTPPAPLPPDPLPLIRRVAERVILDNPQPPSFNWGEGVMMAGMMRAWEATKDPRYLNFVKTWADHWRPQLADVLEGPKPEPGKPPPEAHRIGYCGRWGPGFALVLLHEATGDQAYLDTAEQIVRFMLEKGTRTADGGFGHWHDNKQLWVDTLYMSIPLLTHLARVTGRRELLDEAVRQLDVTTRHNRDETSGLFFHMYDEPSAKDVGVFWCRGNGWVVMSDIEALRRLDRASPEFARVAAAFQDHCARLAALQDAATGLWRTVVDHPETYVETSGSAMILYGLAAGRWLGLLDGSVDEAICRAWDGIYREVTPEGEVVGVSVGTGPSALEDYACLPTASYTWGTGAWLLAACALRENRGMKFDDLRVDARLVLDKTTWRQGEPVAGAVIVTLHRPPGGPPNPSPVRLAHSRIGFVFDPEPAPPEMRHAGLAVRRSIYGSNRLPDALPGPLLPGTSYLMPFRIAPGILADVLASEGDTKQGITFAPDALRRMPLFAPGRYRLKAVGSRGPAADDVPSMNSSAPPSPGPSPDSMQSFDSAWVEFEVQPAPEAVVTPAELLQFMKRDDADGMVKGLCAEYYAYLGHPPSELSFFAPPPERIVLKDDGIPDASLLYDPKGGHVAPPFFVRLAPGAKLSLSSEARGLHSFRVMEYNHPVRPGRTFEVRAWDREGVFRAVCDRHGVAWGWVLVEKTK